MRERVLAAAADKEHLVVPADARLASHVAAGRPEHRMLCAKPDGTLDVERYRMLVGQRRACRPKCLSKPMCARSCRSRQVVAGVAGIFVQRRRNAADSTLECLSAKAGGALRGQRINASDLTARAESDGR